MVTAHAFALLDSYINGFALSETSLPITGPEAVTEVADSMMHLFEPAAHPHLLEFTTEHVLAPGYAYGAEFEYGLDLLLDGLQRAIGDHGTGAGGSGPRR
ncbi:TetR/AcrR family transcriptional regulator C-terminal domain-containing protein [Occultella kanbiaonis]|uniref:TetR/AcrR family transcriptional regulator C-terminal domain-containing protein n=1 Tax=Occultella kanbiaonis TaxID=2675754 RepID=UPI0012B7F7A7